jgi:hypothetical protein
MVGGGARASDWGDESRNLLAYPLFDNVGRRRDEQRPVGEYDGQITAQKGG